MHISPQKLKEKKVTFVVKELHNRFAFKCQKCSNCCSMTKLLIYPFDIINLCEKLRITSEEFHKKYTYFVFDDNGIARCMLRTNPACAFNDKVCTVYEARPLRCMMFPVGRMYKGGKAVYMLPDAGCAGFRSGKKQSIEQWIREIPQELHTFSAQWSKFLSRLKKSGLPLKDKLFAMFFIKIFYDFDNELVYREVPQFRELSTKEKMQAMYELAEKYLFHFEEIKKGLEKIGKFE